MAEWVLVAGSHFPAAVEQFEATPLPLIDGYHGFFFRLVRSDILDRFREPAAKLLLRMLRQCSGFLFDTGDIAKPFHDCDFRSPTPSLGPRS